MLDNLDTTRKYIDVEHELLKISKQYKDLITPEEAKELARVYTQLKNTGIKRAKKLREPAPIEEWVNSEYYLGQETHNIYPYWKQQIIKIINNPVTINQVIITGSIGIGKTTFAALLLLRRIYELSCYENVAALFKLMGVSKIAFAYLSVTRDQAEHSGFSALKEWIDVIPYFKDHFPRHNRLDSFVVFPQENMFVLFGSVANHFIGMNVLASVLDEANFFEGRQKDDANMKMNAKVSGLYSQMVNRSASRFIIEGKNYSLNLLVSSTTVESSFTEQMIEAAKDDPHTYVISPALWEVKPWGLSGEKFLVFAGGEGHDPFIIDTMDDINQLLENYGNTLLHEQDIFKAYKRLPYDLRNKIIEVPVEYRQPFQGDIIIALQDLAGYSVSSSSRFFQNNESYHRALTDEVTHPFTHREIILSTTKSSFQEGFSPIQDYLKPGFKFQNLKQPRFIHLDLALTNDSVGISMGHISNLVNAYDPEGGFVESDDPLDNYVLESTYKLPEVTIDFMLRVNPPKKPNKIAFSKIRDFLIYLRDYMGVRIELITADQFQSAMMLQELEEAGFNTANLSVDRNPDAYNALASVLYEDRIKFYSYPIFYTELFNLINYVAKRKIDHPPKGSKDVSDSVAGVVFNILSAADKTDLRKEDMGHLFIEANLDKDSIEYVREQVTNQILESIGLGGIKILNKKQQ